MVYIIKKMNPLLLVGLLAVGFLFASCEKDDDSGKTTEIQLLSFGPSPALRSGELRFIGTNLDQVSTIVLPNNIQVSNFKSKSYDLITLVVPEETVEGYVTLKTPKGDIKTKTLLTISEPIVFTSFSPAKVKPGATLTIDGDYLNLIKEVIFPANKVVLQSAFVSQSRKKLEVKVPADAKTGIVVISNGAPIPILVESPSQVQVTLPAVTSLSPTPVKAGTNLTIAGTDLDLVKEITFAGGSKVTTFVSQSATQLVVAVPANAKDGAIKLGVASLEEVTTTQAVTMMVPTITGLSPIPAKNGTNLTISGTNLDLVTKVTFAGVKAGTIQSATGTSLVVRVPADALEGAVVLTTAADKTVTSSTSMTLVKPAITSITPMDIKPNSDLTVNGTNLDIVASVKFTGDKEAKVTGPTATSFKVTVPQGTKTGTIKLVTTNGTEVTSTQSINILASTNAVITNMPSAARPGQLIDIMGTSLDEVNEVIFPDNVIATKFGAKTATLIQVVIPENVKRGTGKIRLTTFSGEFILSPDINIQGVEPIQDKALVFFDFDGTGSKDSWWGNVRIEKLPEYTLDGTSYGRFNGNFNGWTDMFWRNGRNNFAGPTVGKNVTGYVIKFDILVLEAVTGGNLKFRLQGSEGDFWWTYGPAATPAGIQGEIKPTNGWVTVTIPLTNFKDNYGWGNKSPTDIGLVDSGFGCAFDNGASKVNICIDNVRFHKL